MAERLPRGLETEEMIEYTDAEIREARNKSADLDDAVRNLNESFYTILEEMYDFQEQRYYHRLGFSNMKDWINSLGYAPRTWLRYLAVYKALTVTLGIPLERYHQVDISKAEQVKRLAEAGGSREDVEAAIEIAPDLQSADLDTSIDEQVREVKKERGVLDEEDEEDPRIVDPIEHLEPGVYRLVKIERGQSDLNPRYNPELLSIKGVKSDYYFDPSSAEVVVEVDIR